MKNTIRVARAKAGLTQAALAEKIGVSRQTVIAIEAGNYVPSTVLALKMAMVFAVPVQELFELEAGD